MTVKEQIIRVIRQLPDTIDYQDVLETIALLAAVRDAERDIEDGRVISNERMRNRIAEWSA